MMLSAMRWIAHLLYKVMRLRIDTKRIVLIHFRPVHMSLMLTRVMRNAQLPPAIAVFVRLVQRLQLEQLRTTRRTFASHTAFYSLLCRS